MSSTFGENIKLSVFGGSHQEAVGMTIDGLPAGFEIDMDMLREFMERRAPGRDKLSTSRKEPDIPRFVSGVVDGKTTGDPVTCVIENKDTRSGDYEEIKNKPRPGHADYTAHIKYNGNEDYRGGGHFSGRLTAPICVAGGIVKQILAKEGISVDAGISEIAGIEIVDEKTKEKAFSEIEKARKDGDSVGGIVGCGVTGLPAGIGGPLFGGLEGAISKAVFGIPAVKGIEFGRGFEASRMRGSENNDPFDFDKDGNVVTTTNNAGGILGGISTGMPVIFRVAFKPTPSIAKEQDTIDYETGKRAKITVKGRHDPCVALRAVPVVEAVCALAVYDLLRGTDNE